VRNREQADVVKLRGSSRSRLQRLISCGKAGFFLRVVRCGRVLTSATLMASHQSVDAEPDRYWHGTFGQRPSHAKASVGVPRITFRNIVERTARGPRAQVNTVSSSASGSDQGQRWRSLPGAAAVTPTPDVRGASKRGSGPFAAVPRSEYPHNRSRSSWTVGGRRCRLAAAQPSQLKSDN